MTPGVACFEVEPLDRRQLRMGQLLLLLLLAPVSTHKIVSCNNDTQFAVHCCRRHVVTHVPLATHCSHTGVYILSTPLRMSQQPSNMPTAAYKSRCNCAQCSLTCACISRGMAASMCGPGLLAAGCLHVGINCCMAAAGTALSRSASPALQHIAARSMNQMGLSSVRHDTRYFATPTMLGHVLLTWQWGALLHDGC